MTSKPGFFDGLIKANRKLRWITTIPRTSNPAACVRAAAAQFSGRIHAGFNGSAKSRGCVLHGNDASYRWRHPRFIATGKYPLEACDPKRWGNRADRLRPGPPSLGTGHPASVRHYGEDYEGFVTRESRLSLASVQVLSLLSFRRPMAAPRTISISTHAPAKRFPNGTFTRSGIIPQVGSVYAIELLEHLSEPYAFVADCYANPLTPGGRFVTTTATNVPQFDHRYNFVSDEEFEQRVCGLGFEMELKRSIPHECDQTEIAARNVFYVFRKNN